MALFHPRVLTRHLNVMAEVSPTKSTVLASWASSLAQGVYDSETQNDAEFIQRVLIGVLDYTGSSSGTIWTLAKNQPVGTGNVDVALGRFTADSDPQIVAPFELKGARTKDLDAVIPGRNKSPVQQASGIFAAIRGSSQNSALRRQFDNWAELSTPVFIGELAKQGLTLSLHEKAEWTELFEKSKAKASPHVSAYRAAREEIDRIICDSFALDASDRSTLQSM